MRHCRRALLPRPEIFLYLQYLCALEMTHLRSYLFTRACQYCQAAKNLCISVSLYDLVRDRSRMKAKVPADIGLYLRVNMGKRTDST